MTRWLPRSLFSRMVLILLTGLVLAQFLSFAIQWQERGQLMLQATGIGAAQRIADIVRLLDSIRPAERDRIVDVINSPALRISFAEPPLPSATIDPEQQSRAALFSVILRRLLGKEQPVVVQVAEAPVLRPLGGGYGRRARGVTDPKTSDPVPPGPGPMGPGMMGGPGMMRGFGPPGFSFVVQTRLTDGTLVTFDSRQPLDAARLPYRLLLSLAVLLVGVIALTLIAVRWVTRPLKTLAGAAEELGEDINRPPLDENGPLEVSRAAHAFNTMQQRLVKFIRDRTRILAAMSHDLKTPITRLRLRSELLDDAKLRAKFTADLEEMESMVGATLDFMRGLESEEPVRPVDVMALLESLQADMSEIGATVKLEGAARAPYPGKSQALKRCLTDLLDNAVKYGKSAVVAVDDDQSRLTIRIADDGPGIPEAELEKVFEPFYRLESSRNRETGGTGLGLTIARSIAESHGGQLTLRNRMEGGLEARLTLPRTGVRRFPAVAAGNRSSEPQGAGRGRGNAPPDRGTETAHG